LLYVTLLKI